MQYTVCNINIGFDAFPDQDHQVYNKPEVSDGLQKFIQFGIKVSAKHQGSDQRGHCSDDDV
jgi:hypothetical protein